MAQNPTYNPYAPPSARVTPRPASAPPPVLGGPLDLDQAEGIRRELINHEASIKSLGSLHVVGGALALIAALGLGGVALFGESPVEGSNMTGGAALLYLLAAAASLNVGPRLRRLDPRVRTFASLLAVIGLFALGVGTLINAYFLFLLNGEKGKRVLSADYQQVVLMTPHIRYKGLSCLTLGFLTFLILLVVVIAIIAFSSP